MLSLPSLASINTSRIHLQVEQFSRDYLLKTGTGPLTSKRIRKIPTQPGRMKEKQERGNRKIPAPMWES